MSWFRSGGDKLVLKLYVQPGAKHTEVVDLHGNALKIRLAAPPIDGKANRALTEFLAKRFNVPNKHVTLKQGALSRHKIVEIYQPAAGPEVLFTPMKVK